MITDADLKKLAKVFATKDDLKSFATKDDLKSFATKDDLGSMNRNIRHLEEKLEKSHTKLSTSIDHAQTGIEVEVRRVERKVDALKERIDTLEDNVTGDIANLQNENLVTSKYNQRLNIVEAKLAIVSQ